MIEFPNKACKLKIRTNYIALYYEMLSVFWATLYIA